MVRGFFSAITVEDTPVTAYAMIATIATTATTATRGYDIFTATVATDIAVKDFAAATYFLLVVIVGKLDGFGTASDPPLESPFYLIIAPSDTYCGHSDLCTLFARSADSAFPYLFCVAVYAIVQ